MVFQKGHTPNNNKQQKIGAWRLGRTIRGKMDEIVTEMFKLLHDEDSNIRLQMIKLLLDRSIGTTKEADQFSGVAGGPQHMSFEVVVKLPEQTRTIDVGSNGKPDIRVAPKAVRSLS